MALQILYGDRRAAWTSVDVTGAARLGRLSFEMRAELGAIGSCSIDLDDPDGDLGHDGDQILGLKTLVAIEDDAPTDNQVIFWGYIHDREYVGDEDSLVTGEAVRIKAQLADINDEARYYIVRGVETASLDSDNGNRLAESVGDRLTWLLGSTFIALSDEGAVVYPTAMMDASDYRGQTGADVLDDCAQRVGYNWFIYRDEAADDYALWFDNPNTSTAWSSDLRVSNILADIDSTVRDGDGATHTWAPHYIKLSRSPEHTASSQYFVWSKGSVFVSRTATADTYGRVDATTADSSVTTSGGATTRGNRLLQLSKDEEDFIEVSIDLPPANVNDVREGQRMQLRTRNLPGYKGDFTWFRVLRRIVAQEKETSEFYTVTMTLSPQAVASALVQTAAERRQDDVTFASDTTPGNLLLYFATWRQLLTSPEPPADGETWTLMGTGPFVDDHDAPDPCAITCYATIATIAQTHHTKSSAAGGSSNGTVIHSVMYELHGVAISDLDVIVSGPNAPATSLDIGSLGPVRMAFAAWGNGWDGFFVSSSGIQTVGFGDWDRDYIASRDYDSGFPASSDALFGAGFPFASYAHSADNDSLEAVTTISDDQTPHHWGGVAVGIP